MLTGGALPLCSYRCVLGSERDWAIILWWLWHCLYPAARHTALQTARHRPCPECLQPRSSSTGREHSQAADDTEQSRTADRTVPGIHCSRAGLQAGREQRRQKRAVAASGDAAAPALSPAPRPPRGAGGRGLPPPANTAPCPSADPRLPGAEAVNAPGTEGPLGPGRRRCRSPGAAPRRR